MARARKFRGPEIVKEIEEAMDKGLGRFLINTQSKLSASSPILTGRLASSWFVGKGVPDRSVAPEMKEGSKPTVTPYSGKITLDSDWYISNSLPYAERAAYDPYSGRRGGGDWFTRIENNLPKDVEKAMDFYLRKVK